MQAALGVHCYAALMSDQVLALKLFIRVARTRSFSRAAREAKLSQPTASRMITLLEENLGVALFSRSTRAVTLTDAGSEYLERIEPVLAALEEAAEAVRGNGELRGTLRIGAASIFVSEVILPRLEKFLATHPALHLEFHIEDKRQNLVNDGVDMMLRFGKLTDMAATSKKLGAWPIVVAAAPSYLKAKGNPARPEDLSKHEVIVSGPTSGGGWTLRSKSKEVKIAVEGRIAISASQVGVNAAVAGLGIIAATELSLARYLENGKLVRVLPAWDLGAIDAHVLFPSGRAAKPAARSFTDFLVTELRAHT